MKTKSKVVAVCLFTLLGLTALNAQMMNSQANCDVKGAKKSAYGMKYGMHQSVMPMLFKLNLTQDQQSKVQKIMTSFKDEMPSPYRAFTADEFDKEQYVSDAMTKKENMIKLRANMISSVYEVLSPKQKSQLRVLMDLKEEKMKQGCQFDKNSHGRR